MLMDVLNHRESEIAYPKPALAITTLQRTRVLLFTLNVGNVFGFSGRPKTALDWVADMMPTRIGQYISPQEIFRSIQRDGYRGTFTTMLTEIRFQRVRQFRGEVLKPYIILEPPRPKNLPEEIPTPLILVPAEQQFVDFVMADQSWAKPFLPKPVDTVTDEADSSYDPDSPYAPSLWSFDAQVKGEMLGAMRRRRVNGSLMSLIDEFMISRMGQYVHPYDLLAFMKGKKIKRNLLYLLSQIFADPLREDLPYRIVRPTRPVDLPKYVNAPLVLVPVSYVVEVENDTMWRKDVSIPPGLTSELDSLLSESRALSAEIGAGNEKLHAAAEKLEQSLSRADDLLGIAHDVQSSLSQFLPTLTAYANEVECVADFWDKNGNFVEIGNEGNGNGSGNGKKYNSSGYAYGAGNKDTSCLEWISKFRGRESLEIELGELAKQCLTPEELESERQKRLNDPMYIIQDVLKVLEVSSTHSMSIDEIRALLPFRTTAAMVLVALTLAMEDCRKLGSYSGTEGNMQRRYTEPFEVKRHFDEDSQIIRYQLTRRSAQ